MVSYHSITKSVPTDNMPPEQASRVSALLRKLKYHLEYDLKVVLIEQIYVCNFVYC